MVARTIHNGSHQQWATHRVMPLLSGPGSIGGKGGRGMQGKGRQHNSNSEGQRSNPHTCKSWVHTQHATRTRNTHTQHAHVTRTHTQHVHAHAHAHTRNTYMPCTCTHAWPSPTTYNVISPTRDGSGPGRKTMMSIRGFGGGTPGTCPRPRIIHTRSRIVDAPMNHAKAWMACWPAHGLAAGAWHTERAPAFANSR
jgi:hypothetical protein